MKITIAGSLGSGKSTLRNMLAELYGLKIKGTGDFMRELRRYSEQIETALDEYEENIMKIEEEISNNTLCN